MSAPLRLALAAALLAACVSKPTPRTDAVVNETEVTYEAAGLTVHGTITLPAAPGPHPAVLLIAGSGPTDRDWNNPLLPGTNGSARLLARALAEKGIASLRYDKRGTGKTPMPTTLAWSDYLAEQKGGLALLAAHEQVNKEALFVAGHSEGGTHALRLSAERDVSPAGWILLSTAGRPLRDVVVGQVGTQLRAVQYPDAETEIAALGNALDEIAAGREVHPAAVTKIPGIQNLLRAMQAPVSIAFGREILSFDPVAAIGKVPGPVLVLSGDKDLQVDVDADARALAAGKPDATLVVVPDADHVLKHETRANVEASAAQGYNADGRSLAPGVVDAIAKFVADSSKS